MQEALAAGLEAGGAVGQDTLALGSADPAAEVGLAGCAEFALAALGCAGCVVNRESKV